MKLEKELGVWQYIKNETRRFVVMIIFSIVIQVEESERNTEKLDQLLVQSTHKLGSHILSVSKQLDEVKEGTSLRYLYE